MLSPILRASRLARDLSRFGNSSRLVRSAAVRWAAEARRGGVDDADERDVRVVLAASDGEQHQVNGKQAYGDERRGEGASVQHGVRSFYLRRSILSDRKARKPPKRLATKRMGLQAAHAMSCAWSRTMTSIRRIASAPTPEAAMLAIVTRRIPS